MAKDKRAQIIIEYIVLFIIIIAALFFFSGYIRNAMIGQWRKTGDSLGSGRVYDYENTVKQESSENKPFVKPFEIRDK